MVCVFLGGLVGLIFVNPLLGVTADSFQRFSIPAEKGCHPRIFGRRRFDRWFSGRVRGLLIVVGKDSPINSMADLLAAAGAPEAHQAL